MADYESNAGKLKIEATGNSVDLTLMGGGPPKTESMNRKVFANVCRGFLKWHDTTPDKPEERRPVSLPESAYQSLQSKAAAQGKTLDQLLTEAIGKV